MITREYQAGGRKYLGVESRFSEGLNELWGRGSRPLTPKAFLEAKIVAFFHPVPEYAEYPLGQDIWPYGFRLSSAVVYRPNEGNPLWVKDFFWSHLIKTPDLMTKAHIEGREFLLNGENKSLYDALLFASEHSKVPLEERDVLVLPKKETFNFSMQAYPEILEFACGLEIGHNYMWAVSARKDEKTKQPLPINELPFTLLGPDYVDSQNQPFIRPVMWHSIHPEFNGGPDGTEGDFYPRLGNTWTRVIGEISNSNSPH